LNPAHLIIVIIILIIIILIIKIGQMAIFNVAATSNEGDAYQSAATVYNT